MEMSQCTSLHSYLKQAEMSFSQKQNRKIKQSGLGVGTSGRGGHKERVWEGECGGNTVHACMKWKSET
jgi:hypothetical protein